MGSLYKDLTNNFTQIPNLIISDTNIKHTSFRLYCYYASKPDGWKIRNTDVIEKLGISKDTIALANKNLIENGWVSRFKEKNTDGTFKGSYSYQLYSVPTIIGKNPNSVNPENGKNPTLNNTDKEISEFSEQIKGENKNLPPLIFSDNYEKELEQERYDKLNQYLLAKQIEKDKKRN